MGEVVFIAALALVGIIMLIYYGRQKRPVMTALLSMVGGGVSLVAASWAAGMLGLALKLNLFTAYVSLVLGLPGVSLLLIKEVFFKA